MKKKKKKKTVWLQWGTYNGSEWDQTVIILHSYSLNIYFDFSVKNTKQIMFFPLYFFIIIFTFLLLNLVKKVLPL